MKLFHKQYGDKGEYIFILHGIFGMLDNWHNIARALSAEYRVVCIDARNHGQSPHSAEMSYDLMADDVIELADEFGLNDFILMGHSMGGKTAIRTALKYPQRIKKLLIIDIAPKAYQPGHLPYFKAFEEIQWSTLNTRKEVDQALSHYESDSGVRLFLAKNIERAETGEGFVVKSNLPAIQKAYKEIVGEFEMSGQYAGNTLFMTGGLSKYLKETDQPLINTHFPNTTYVQIPDAGHWVHADNPVKFIEAVLLFLKQ